MAHSDCLRNPIDQNLYAFVGRDVGNNNDDHRNVGQRSITGRAGRFLKTTAIVNDTGD